MPSKIEFKAWLFVKGQGIEELKFTVKTAPVIFNGKEITTLSVV